MIDFIKAVLGEDVPGAICFGLISADGDPKRPVNDHYFYLWPDENGDAAAFLDRHTDEDVYYIPAVFSYELDDNENIVARALKECVIDRPVLAVDADDASPDLFALTPSMIVQSSPDRWQLYYQMKEPIEFQWAEQMSRSITYSQSAAGSDKTGWNNNKFLRVPGTRNTKPAVVEKLGHSWTVEASFTGIEYSMQQIEEGFGTIVIQLGEDISEELPVNLPDKSDVLAKLPATEGIRRMLFQPPHEDKWSETMFLLILTLLRMDLTLEEVFVVTLGCACDKFARDGKPNADLLLWKDINRAWTTVSREIAEGIHINDVDITKIHDDHMDPVVVPIDFLSEEERALLKRETFIDHYVRWGQTKTDADASYHEASALMILSTVLSDFGHAMPVFGKLGLNLWVMILGTTSTTRKTTTKSMMMRYIDKLSNEEYDYDLGSDSTTEGMLADLSERPGRSGLFYRDEAQEMLAGARGGKGYLSDFTGTLTELYDGWVRGRRRATGAKKTPRSETTFNLYLMGIVGKVTEVLNPGDFESGFLARFIYYFGEGIQETRESLRLNQAEEGIHGARRDDGQEMLQNQLDAMRAFWENKTEPGNTVPIFVDGDAWDRLNEYIFTLVNLANQSDRPEIMKPASDRMNKSVLKLACLLAMSEHRDHVSMTDMLTAIRHSERWYASLQRMTRLIDASQWASQMRKLTELIVEKKGKMKYGDVYKRFSDMKPRDFAELVEGVVVQGSVKLTLLEGGMRMLEVIEK
jgi:hypothetical protein